MKAIETRYNGYRFRSRLEARWAVFFDKLAIDWEYEPEGFDTGEGLFLPDFCLHYGKEHAPVWAEVKPSLDAISDADWKKMHAFGVEHRLLLLVGTPDLHMYPQIDENHETWEEAKKRAEDEFPSSGWALTSYKGRPWADEWSNFYPSDDMVPSIREAVTAARSARFEFGESGASNV